MCVTGCTCASGGESEGVRYKPELIAMIAILMLPVPRVLFLMAFVVVAFSANAFRRVLICTKEAVGYD